MASSLGPRNLGDIIGETFGIYKRNFLKLLGIAAIVFVILYVLVVLLMLPIIIALMSGDIESLDLFVLTSFIPLAIITFVILVVFVIVGYPLMEGALIQAVSEQSLGKTIGIGRAYRLAWRRLGAMIGAMILAGLALFGMSITIIGIPFAIYFGVRWIFIWQAALVEGVGPRAALSRSSDAVKGDWWRVVGIVVVVSIIAAVVNSVLGLLPIVGSTIGTIISTPIGIIGATLLYYDLRVRKQGYSLETLATELSVELDSGVA